MVAADREQLERAVVNLITNAVKFTPSGGRVELVLTTDETTASIVVSDTGCGIPELEAPRVFERFFRSSTPENQLVPGTGLGLAITKAIIDQHGGSIELRSLVGVGTTVTATLPVLPTDQAIPDFSAALHEAQQCA
jgi:signal transduction histidine kinase